MPSLQHKFVSSDISSDISSDLSSDLSSDQLDMFHKLVQKLSDALGPSSGLDSDDVDPMDIQKLMEEYTSNEDEWHQYALPDRSRPYTRNLVDEGNGKSNLLIVVWSPGKGSPIHDHADAHCVMKVLKGSLRETLYAMPRGETGTDRQPGPLTKTCQRIYSENQVTYISDKIGLHKIENANPNELSISLHLYTPPHAARFGFHLFDEKTGKASHIKGGNVYSNRGQKL